MSVSVNRIDFNILSEDIVKTQIIKVLEKTSFLSFRATDKKNRTICNEQFEAMQKKIFQNTYGKFTSFDLLEGIDKAYIGIENALKMRELDWDSQEKKGQNKVFLKKNPFFNRYQLYRGKAFSEILEKFRAILDKIDNVLEELNTTPFHKEHPLQELRDRTRRIQIEQYIRKNVEKNLQITKNYFDTHPPKMSRIEKIIFSIMAWGHSFFEKPATPLSCVQPIRNQDVMSFKKFNLRHRVVFGETTMNFKEESISIELSANFKPQVLRGAQEKMEKFDGFTYFTFRRKDTQEILGKLSIDRLWSSRSGNASERNLKDHAYLTNRRLNIEIKEALSREDSTGDYPMKRLLIQLAVEIFLLESEESCLEITACGADPGILQSGGFYDASWDSFRANIMDALKGSRKQGKLFPDEDFGERMMRIFKRTSSEGDTEIMCRHDKELKTALVDWTLSKFPITWQEYIQKNPLLIGPRGPILPKFLKKNLFIYEQN